MKKSITSVLVSLLVLVSVFSSSLFPFALAEGASNSGQTTASYNNEKLVNNNKISYKKKIVDSNGKEQVKSFTFDLIARQGDLELHMIDEDGVHINLAVRNTKTGETLYACPTDVSGIEAEAKVNEASSLAFFYVREDSAVYHNISTVDLLKNGSVDIDYNSVENGVKITYTDNTYNYKVPLIFRLKDGCFEAAVDFAGIDMDVKDTALLNISILPYFGAAKRNTDSYIFVPDGSGALIDNNFVSLDGENKEYSQFIYGKDLTVETISKVGNSEQITLPVFGVKSEKNAFVAVVDKGAALGKIVAAPSLANLPYGFAYAEFAYQTLDSFDRKEQFSDAKYTRLSDFTSQIDECVVKYYLLSGDDADYVGMAKKYRDYLIDQGVDNNVDSDLSFYFDVVGAIKKEESKFGIVTEVVKEMTTFDQASDMVTSLDKSGVKNIKLRYLGWMDGGLEDRPVVNANVESKIGGKKGLMSLKETMDSVNAELFLDVEFVKIYKTRLGWLQSSFAAETILDTTALQYYYNLSTGIRDPKKGYMLMTPGYLSKEAESFVSDFSQYGIGNISAGTLGNTAYTEYSQKAERFADRSQVTDKLAETLSYLDKNSDNTMVDVGYSYSIPYADYIIGAPMYDSGYEVCKTDVPFLQIALHGIVNYTETAHNLSYNLQTQMLRQLETGAAPYYIFTYSNCSQLQGTFMNYVYTADFETWKETAISHYKELSAVLDGYNNKEIIDHQIITDDVRITTYDGGLSVIVNYGKRDYNYKGSVVKAQGYTVLEEGK